MKKRLIFLSRKRKIVLITTLVTVFLFTLLAIGYFKFGSSLYKADTNPLPDYGVNILSDPGFENSTKWTNLPQKWQLTTDFTHSGSQSLKYTNDDPDFYRFPGIDLPLSRGDIYTISVWVKTEDVVCSTEPGVYGADFDIEWKGLDGKYLNGGAYVHDRLMGTQDWTKLSASTFPISFDVTKISANLFVRKGCTGSVWYDDLEIVLSDGTVFRPQVSYPNYRNTFLPNQSRDLQFDVEYRGTDHSMIDGNTLAVELKNSEGTIIWQANQVTSSNQQRYHFTTNLDLAPPGNYSIVTRVNNASNQIILTKNSALTIDAADTPLPKIYVDQYNRTIKDGQPFFPLGVYCSVLSTDVMDKIKAINFNTTISYSLPYGLETSIQRTLNQANDRQLNVLYNLVGTQYPSDKPYAQQSWTSQSGTITGGANIMEAMVNSFKSYPALLGWYTNDEFGAEYLNQLRDRYDFIKANDYNHPTWTVLYTGQNYSDYFSTTDIMGVDSYPIWGNRSHPANPIKFEVTGQASKTLNNAGFGAYPYWLVPEANVTNETGVRPASYTEMLNSAFQGLVNGARGLIYYNISSVIENTDSVTILNDMQQLGTYVNKITSIALGVDVPSEKQLTSSNSKISLLTRTVDNNIYVMAVNPYNEKIDTNFTLPSTLGTVNSISVGLPNEANSTLSLANNQFSDQFEPLGTRIYKLNFSVPAAPTAFIPSITYKDKITIRGHKEDDSAQILINNSADGVVIDGNNWRKEIQLVIGVKSVFSVVTKMADGKTSGSVNFEIVRHKPADANNDGSVNFRDFSSLMSNWSKQESANVSDFNEDGKIDMSDFSILMSNWEK